MSNYICQGDIGNTFQFILDASWQSCVTKISGVYVSFYQRHLEKSRVSKPREIKKTDGLKFANLIANTEVNYCDCSHGQQGEGGKKAQINRPTLALLGTAHKYIRQQDTSPYMNCQPECWWVGDFRVGDARSGLETLLLKCMEQLSTSNILCD